VFLEKSVWRFQPVSVRAEGSSVRCVASGRWKYRDDARSSLVTAAAEPETRLAEMDPVTT
jgi:hypothetical protein